MIVSQLLACHPRPQGATKAAARRVAKPWPRYEAAPARAALLRIGQRCYRGGLRTHPQIFARGGKIVIRWRADRKGDLLSFDFVENTFGSWEVDPAGRSMPRCMVDGVKGLSGVRWPKGGWAPLRLSAPASSAPVSRPAASRRTGDQSSSLRR